MSDDDIAGTYDIAANGALTLASGGSKTITVTTGSGFDIDNSADDMSKNATYAVVAPGTHTFRIRYWLRNTTDNPAGTIDGTVSKIITLNCTAGSIQDITANLDPHDYDGNHYYMWDAKEQYWKGYEWTKNLGVGVGQPTVNYWFPGGAPSSNYPKRSDADGRFYHEGSSYIQASNSCAGLPNVNEMTWYAAYGDSRWDADELWTTMGHLYKGGRWFKKKSVLLTEGNYNSNTAYDGTDWRLGPNDEEWNQPLLSLPSAADASNYFYLPALGQYTSTGMLYYIEMNVIYWSSSGHSWDGIPAAYALYFDRYSVRVMKSASRGYGLLIGTFE